jgi:hypothetical protein
MNHPWHGKKRTERQCKQFDLYHALGSTVAMKCWVRSLVPVLRKTKLARISTADYEITCNQLANILAGIELTLRDELRTMRKESVRKNGR